MTRTATAGRNTDAAGLLFGLGAYGIWGLFPGFFPLLQPAGPGRSWRTGWCGPWR